MERWQPLMPSVQLRLVLELAARLFFPRQQCFTETHSGLLSVFIPGEPFVEHTHEFPAWAQFDLSALTPPEAGLRAQYESERTPARRRRSADVSLSARRPGLGESD